MSCNRRRLWLSVGAMVIAGLSQAAPPVLEDFATVLPQLPPPLRAQLQQRAALWSGWSEPERAAFTQRMGQWDSLSGAERATRRERYLAWRALPATERTVVAAAATRYAALPAERQQALREHFDALDSSERRGWLLGPALGADYPALQPLLAQVPAAEHAPLLAALQEMSPTQRRDLAVLVQRTPPQERELLRRELISTAAANREQWLWSRLDR
ncbi:MAG: DUF3106 domain-containing protein [Lysobacter sp.]